MKFTNKTKKAKSNKYQDGGQTPNNMQQAAPPQQDMELLQKYLSTKVQEGAIDEKQAQEVIEKFMSYNQEERQRLIAMIQEQMPNMNPQSQGIPFNLNNQQ